MRWLGAIGYELLSAGSTASQHADVEDVLNISDPFNSGMCHLRFRDPIGFPGRFNPLLFDGS
jgi:hypothetical protein